jgi:hypothetical protein
MPRTRTKRFNYQLTQFPIGGGEKDMAVLTKEGGGGGRPAKVKTGSIRGNRKAKFAIGKIKRG